MGLIQELDFSGESTKVHIKAIYSGGKFIDPKSGKPIKLKNDSLVKIIAFRDDLSPDDLENFKTIRKVVLKKGEELWFELANTSFIFRLKLLDDLYFMKELNKPPRADDCRCQIFSAHDRYRSTSFEDFEPVTVETLNQAYFRMSVKYRENAASHTTNIYKTFKLSTNQLLEVLRENFE